MRKFFSTLLVTTFLFTATAQKARSAEIVLITAGGIVATLVVYGIGAAGYGSYLLTLESMRNKEVQLKSETYEHVLDVVASQDESIMTEDVRTLISDLRSAAPELESISDMELLGQIVDGINQF